MADFEHKHIAARTQTYIFLKCLYFLLKNHLPMQRLHRSVCLVSSKINNNIRRFTLISFTSLEPKAPLHDNSHALFRRLWINKNDRNNFFNELAMIASIEWPLKRSISQNEIACLRSLSISSLCLLFFTLILSPCECVCLCLLLLLFVPRIWCYCKLCVEMCQY